jgi:hypothetical protein
VTTPIFCSFSINKLRNTATVTIPSDAHSPPWLRGLGHRVYLRNVGNGRASYDIPYGQRLLIIAAAVERFGLIPVHVLDALPEPPPPPRGDCTEACQRAWTAQCSCRCQGKWHARLRWGRRSVRQTPSGFVTSWEVDRYKGRRIIKRAAA